MKPLTHQEKELILDGALGMLDAEQSDRLQDLLAADPEAAALYARLEQTVAPLQGLEAPACPDELVGKTVAALKAAAQSDTSRQRLGELIGTHSEPTPVIINPWRQYVQIAVVAAIVVFIVAVVPPSASLVRQAHYRQSCTGQLVGIFAGLSAYMGDYDGALPCVEAGDGTPWYKVGDQGDQPLSNTRPYWLLVRQGYAQPQQFVCPGRQPVRNVRYRQLDVTQLKDFPSPHHVSYSFRLQCPNTSTRAPRGAIISDRNPVTERLLETPAENRRIALSEQDLTSNSRNHRRKGQNLLTADGSVRFCSTRFLPGETDDFFALQEMRSGFELKGIERPSNPMDTFLAP